MEIVLTAGLGLFGYLLYNNKIQQNLVIRSSEYIDPTNNKLVNNYKIKEIDTVFSNNYKSNIINQDNKKYYNKLATQFKNSMNPASKIVNTMWRIENDSINKYKLNQINNMLSNDINMIKNNNIENMDNLSNDSVFSDNYSLANINQKNINVNMLDAQKKFDNFSNSDYNSDSDNNNKWMNDVVSNLSGENNSIDSIPECPKKINQFEKQFDQLEFNHTGIPGTFNNVKPINKLFNNQGNLAPQSNFKPNGNGRYNVTSDMTHDNMLPNFRTPTYGFNPSRDKEMENYSIRKIETFSGSDTNPQFKRKTEVKPHFDPITNKVESVTGMPNFNNFFESRYIPSDKRQGEKPFQPVRVTPGLNLGYTQTGNTGKQDLYRALPKTVDQLRAVTNPKVSYKTPIVPGQKGERPGIIGKMVQQGPDRFFYNSPDSLMPTTGDYTAPAIHGKYLAPHTSRSLNSENKNLNPLGGVEKSTPAYLQGQFHTAFKKTHETNGPRNVTNDTQGHNVTHATFRADNAKRTTENTYLGPTSNKHSEYLANHENMVPGQTHRETVQTQNNNLKGSYTSVPLINYFNYIPEITQKEILLADNGRKNLTNISNSVKSYLFNAINSIPDPTLRTILSEKIILTNTKGNSSRGQLFNNKNAITDLNIRNTTENNLILANLSNHEQGYLFNNINGITDPTLRNLINVAWESGGVGFKGNNETGQMFNYQNNAPNTTMRETMENTNQINNVSGPENNQYMYNYINSAPETTLRELANSQDINNLNGSHKSGYLFNNDNSKPTTTLRELAENNVNLTNTTGNMKSNYIFNHDNSIPQTTIKEMTEEVKFLNNVIGNYKADTLYDYENGVPASTLREHVENTKNLIGIGSKYLEQMYLFNYSDTAKTTMRELIENMQNLTNIGDTIMKKGTMFNYDDTPSVTNRNMTETTKNITGTTGVYSNKEYIFNYENNTPNNTNRNITEQNKNIAGTKGDGTQERARMDYGNALLNVEKEVIAKGRKPVTVKQNKGPNAIFTEYAFCDDNQSNMTRYSNTKPMGNIKNELFFG
jgi:hypothetical protein